jgi:nicotinamidase-related amidase
MLVKKLLLVVDTQNDFITGSLGTKEAQAVIPNVLEKLKEYNSPDAFVLFSLDTHGDDYLTTQEGRNLPTPHCIKHSRGWERPPEIAEAAPSGVVFEKNSFGSTAMAEYIKQQSPDEIEVIGLVTDICVISNVLILKALMPETPITVDASCCAGTTPEAHRAALAVMRSCQADVI